MNPMTMAGMNAGNPAMGGGMPMMNNGANGVQMRQPEEHEETNYESRLNTYIYGYFLKKGQWDLARSFKNSGQQFEPPIVHGEGNMNGADDQNDSKDGIDSKRPDDLPDVGGDDRSGSFLLSWFALFWDIYWAQRKSNRATPTARDFVAISQQQARQRDQQQQQMMRTMPGMVPGMDNYQAQMMRHQQMFGGMANGNDMRRGVLQNNARPNAQQLAMFQNQARAQQQQQQQMMNQMRRDPSEMNGQRPRTPSGGDHAPSPSKRQRIDGVPFNGAQMMPNGRPMPPGMPGQQMIHNDGPQAQHANQLLMNNGINPGNLSEAQFASFQQQNPSVQAKSIQVYAQNMTKHQRGGMEKAGGMSDGGGSPMMQAGMDINPDFFASNPGAAQQMRNGGILPNGAPNGNGGNHALQDYQMQLMLLEQQNKKRLLMARQEQDTITRPEGQPGMPGPAGFATGMSPQGSRGGSSPQPGDQARRGTPKMGQPGMPGSPMPNGQMTGSPAAMNFSNMDPSLYGQMRGQMPPSSNPAFPGQTQFTPQQMEAMRAQAGNRMPNGNGNWPQGPQGQPQMMQSGQPQQPPPMGTPQPRSTEMPPPQGLPATAANGRPGSPAAAPPTPQQSTKANPKGKKDSKAKKPTKKNSTAGTTTSVAATPAADGENPTATPTPSTPITPQHQNSFAPKNEAQGPPNSLHNANANGQPQIAAPQPDINAGSQFTNMEATGGEDYSMPFNNDLNDPNLLENFDFEQFLQGDAFGFDTGAFEDGSGGIEPLGTGDA